MSRNIKHGLVIAAGLLLCGAAKADVFTQWLRMYHVAPNAERFVDVAVDPAGNVYAIGQSFNGVDNDALIVRYGPGGGLYWAIKFTGAGEQIGRNIRVTSDGLQVYATYDSGDRKTVLVRLNPGSGAAMWSAPRTVPPPDLYSSAGLCVDESSGTRRLFWPIRYRFGAGGNSMDCFVYSETGSAVTGISWPTGNPNRVILGVAGRPQGGVYYLLGKDPIAGPPASDVWAFNYDGVRTQVIATPNASCIASTTFADGQLFAVGGYSGNRISLKRIRTDTNAVTFQADNVLLGVTDIDILDLAADKAGGVYAAGYETVTGSGKEWFLARYNWVDFVRTWRNPRPMTAVDDVYRRVKVDGYGNLGVAAHRSGAVQGFTTQIFDCVSGIKLGETGTTSSGSLSGFSCLASNADGWYGSAGTVLDAGSYKGLAWLTRQRGLKRLSTPKVEYVGGTSVTCTVTMYGASTGVRSVALSSSTSLAPVPPSVNIPAAGTTAGLTIVTGRTSSDTPATITGTFEGITRTTFFTVLAPRPSNLTFTPPAVTGGSSSTGQVTMTGPAPAGGVVVNLSCNKTEVTVPANVTVPGGASLKTFTATTVPVLAQVIATVNATANGTTKTKTLTVNP